MKFSKFSIKWQLIGICLLLVSVPVLSLVYLSHGSIKTIINQQTEHLLHQESVTINNDIKNIYNIAQEKVNSDLNVARESLRNYGYPQLSTSSTMEMFSTNQITQESKNITVPSMIINRNGQSKGETETLAFNYDIVDNIQEMVGGTVTIFQVIPEGLLRISTNVLKSDGERAVGTYIPVDSPVYKTVMAGNTYYGRAFVVNAWYMTAYEPIRDRNDEIIGVLYVGVKEDTYQQMVLNTLSKIVIGSTGYIWIVDDNGQIILSKNRQRDGEIVWDAKDTSGNYFVQEMITRAKALPENKTYLHYYPWQNKGEKSAREMLGAATYFPEWGWTISSSAYHEEFLTGLNKININSTIIALVSILLGTIIAYLFAIYITKPVVDLEKITNLAANGDLSDITDGRKIKGTGEVAKLSGSFNAMIMNIKQLIAKIKGNVSSTALSAENLSSSAEEVNAAMQQISSTVQQIAAGAQNVSNVVVKSRKASNETEERAKKGSEAVGIVNDKMNTISNTIQDGAEKMRALGEKSSEIGNIVDAINNITKQTNLLALNASIEAARAGEAGRGFAVVADEVRKLAEESEKSTAQISELTTSIQSEIIASVDNMETSTKQVREGVDSVQKALEAFEVIPKLVEGINRSLIEVSATTEENAAGSGEVSSAIQQITSSMQQVSDTAQKLNKDAESLKKLVSSFNIGDEVSSISEPTPAAVEEKIAAAAE